MNSYKFLYLFWLLPLSFLFLIGQQSLVYYGINDTFENGTSYTAEVVDFDLKQIAAQTNGYIILRFETNKGEEIERKLSLPVEMAGELQQIRVVPVRYNPGGWQEILLLPTIETQKSLVWTNALMAFVALLITFGISITAHRFANKKLTEEDQELVIERID
ncbi:hypothetical protein [Fodinibius halophilus]|uniref:DUF3592 domain-containing protein n=1 Tax=Fodinibius halophilus TaxID=1736908 RepID=A0A6M1T871_9BACT|nr:hypothetical protein [Fodinibius halophilus]NGP88181.1 hypothetical protein [Fodinibius halophilus]